MPSRIQTAETESHRLNEDGTLKRSAVSTRIRESLSLTESYLVARRFRGYDPYDALSSPLFQVPVLRGSSLMRAAAQQLLRRFPVNVRPLLGIRRGYNPVTLGLALRAYAYLAAADPQHADYYRGQAEHCLSELQRLRSAGYSGACWGYDFDWQTRHGLISAGTPTIVATGFVTTGLYEAHRLLGMPNALRLCESACGFLRKDLHATKDTDGAFCWSYSPLDRSAVLNATMKGARLCAAVYELTGDKQLASLAERTVRFVSRRQRTDGSWPYAVGDERTWADNFHTGYVLECLAEYERCTGDDTFASQRQRGWEHYRRSFFTDEGLPKYYDNRIYPIDATACAQAILTLCRFGDVNAATRVAIWAVEHMQRPDGAFVYQIHRRYSNRIPYVRWSAAWMFCALARLLLEDGRRPFGCASG